MKIKYYKQICTLGNIALQTTLSITGITVNMHSFNTGCSCTQAPIKTSFFHSERIRKCVSCNGHVLDIKFE